MIAYLNKRLNIDANYFIRGGIWMSIAQVASIITAFATTVLFANNLSENAFGTYRYLIGVGGVLSVLSISGMSSSTLQATAKGITDYVRRGTAIQFQYDSIAYFAGTSIALYYYIQSDTQLAAGLLIVTLLVPLHNSLQNIFSYLEGMRKYKQASLFHSLKTIIAGICTIGTLALTHNIIVLLTVFLGTQAVANLLIYLKCRPQKLPPIETDLEHKYLSYAKHTSVRNIINTIATRADSILIFQNLGATELAIFSIANVLPEQVKSQFKNLARLLVPKYVAYNHSQIIRKNILLRSIQLFIFALIITVIFLIFAPFLYSIFLPNYPEAILLSQLTAFAFPAMIAIIPMSALQSQHQESALHYINILGSSFSLVITIAFILFGGLLGAVIAKIISRYSFTLLAYYFFYKSY